MTSTPRRSLRHQIDPDDRLRLAPFELALLRLHLVVAIGAADGRLDGDERRAITGLVDSWELTPADLESLRRRLRRLLREPPALESLLRRIVLRASGDLGEVIVGDLYDIAHADGEVDPREENMLRMVCGALRIEPRSLHDPERRARPDVSAEELAEVVRGILGLPMDM